MGIRPGRIRGDRHQGLGVLEITAMLGIQLTGGDGQRSIDAIAAAVGANDIAMASLGEGADDRAPIQGVRCAPVNGSVTRRHQSRFGADRVDMRNKGLTDHRSIQEGRGPDCWSALIIWRLALGNGY